MDTYNNYNGYSPAGVQNTVVAAMKKVYVKMTLALVVTALTALLCANSAEYVTFVRTHGWFWWVLAIGEIAMVWYLSARIMKLPSATASAMFYLFSVLNGMMLFTIFYQYSPGAITKTFFITAGTFGAMSIFGYTTHQDLTKIGNLLLMAIIGLFIALIVNIFMHSDTLGWIISIAGVIIFVGLTAWDTQQIKKMATMLPADQSSRLATIGALNLYLDFINLFLFLLNIFGGSRD